MPTYQVAYTKEDQIWWTIITATDFYEAREKADNYITEQGGDLYQITPVTVIDGDLVAVPGAMPLAYTEEEARYDSAPS